MKKVAGKSLKKATQSSPYFVYILRCADGTFYTGTTNDIANRVLAHNSSKTGARYTKSRRPVKLVYSESCKNVGMALSREYTLKQFSRNEKLALIRQKRI